MNTAFTIDAIMNEARLSHLGSLGLDLRAKRVLEVGAGIGLLTHLWEELDCEIISTEVRQENIDYNLYKHPWRRGIVFQRDVMQPDSHADFGTFDIVFCYGILYHVPDPAFVIRDLGKLCGSLFLVESMVTGMTDDPCLVVHPEGSGVNQGIYDRACKPTRGWYMQELGTVFPYAYATKTQPRNTVYYPLLWPTMEGYIARCVFVASRQELSLPGLSATLPMRQEYCEETL